MTDILEILEKILSAYDPNKTNTPHSELERIASSEPTDAAGFIQRGRAKYDLGLEKRRKLEGDKGLSLFKEALEDLTTAIKQEESAEVYLNRGLVHGMLDKTNAALEDFEKSIKLKETAETYFEIGLIHYNGSAGQYGPRQTLDPAEYQKATNAFNTAITLKPDFADAYCYLGWLNVLFRKYHKAHKFFKKAIEIDPENAPAQTGLGYVYEEGLKNPEEAAKKYQKAIELDPCFILSYVNLERLKEKNGLLEEAIALCDKIIEKYQKYADWYIKRAELKQKTEKLDEAAEDLKKAIALKPSHVNDLHARIAAIYSKLGKKDDALRHYDAFIEEELSYRVFGYILRGNFYVSIGELDKAMADFNTAIEKRPVAGNAYASRACLKIMMGKKEEAVADYEKAIDIKSKFKSPANHYDSDYAKEDIFSKWVDLKLELGKGQDVLQYYDKEIENSDGAAKYEYEKASGAKITSDQKASKLFSDRGHVKLRMGLLGAVNDFKIAIDLEQKTSYYGSRNLDAYLGLAKFYKQTGQEELAEEYQKKYEDYKEKSK